MWPKRANRVLLIVGVLLLALGGVVFVVLAFRPRGKVIHLPLVPESERSRLRLVTEGIAVRDMRSLVEAQREFKKGLWVDQDGDSRGEYGWIDELVGDKPRRRRPDGTRPSAQTPVFPYEEVYGSFFLEGELVSSGMRGYDYVMFLPYSSIGGMDDAVLDAKSVFLGRGEAGEWFAEWGNWSTPLDPATHAGVIDLQEEHFVVYALPNGNAFRWPGVWGRYAYVTNEKGEVHYTEVREGERYKWDPNPELRYRAAFVDDGTTDTYFNNPLADGQKAFDGRIWHKLKPEQPDNTPEKPKHE